MNNLNEKLDVLKFIGQIGGSIKEINNKVIDGKLRADAVDIKKAAYELDQFTGSLPQKPSPQPAAQPSHVQLSALPEVPLTVPAPAQEPTIDTNQLEFSFDRKYNINDVFGKIDEVYRKMIQLEKNFKELEKLILEEKKS